MSSTRNKKPQKPSTLASTAQAMLFLSVYPTPQEVRAGNVPIPEKKKEFDKHEQVEPKRLPATFPKKDAAQKSHAAPAVIQQPSSRGMRK